MQKLRTEKGITLMALVIAIIVMLILVGVSVTVALNGGLFRTAKQARDDTEAEKIKEEALASGEVEVNGKKYASYQDYLDGNELVILPEGLVVATDEERATAWPTETVKNEKVKAIKETATGKIIPLPEGFNLSGEEGENTVDGGLVITDEKNEFVWIPVNNSSTYKEYGYSPLTYGSNIDSQETLNKIYGMKEDNVTPYYDYSDFSYKQDGTNIENSIKTYGGFYVGRYETTIDGNTIGVQKGKTVLTSATILKEGRNANYYNEPYYYRWWGLYKAQKDMYATNEVVGSLMISTNQQSAITSFVGVSFSGYNFEMRETNTYTNTPDLSGSAYATDNTQYDVLKNIYDLAGNVSELTATDYDSCGRIFYGGSYYRPNGVEPDTLSDFMQNCDIAWDIYGSRVALYIK